MRSILREVHFLRCCPTLGGAQWDGVERGDKKRKGKHKMKKENEIMILTPWGKKSWELIRKALENYNEQKEKETQTK